MPKSYQTTENHDSMAEFAFRSTLGFEKLPPVDPPSVVEKPFVDQWMPWPWPKVGRTVPALKDETFAAQAGLRSIIKDIVPLQQVHSDGTLTQDYLTASMETYERIISWWNTLTPCLKSLEVMDEAPPHLFMVT